MVLSVMINVTEEEFERAKAFFDANPDEIKFHGKGEKNEKGQSEGHNFVKIAGGVYALNNATHVVHEPDAGLGAFGRAKRAVNSDGDYIVVKVEGQELKEKISTEETKRVDSLMQETGYMLDRVEREVQPGESGRVKSREHYDTKTKVLTAFEYRGDRDLYRETVLSSDSKKPPNNLIYALHAMRSIEALHQLNIIHKDIKEENFVLNGKGTSLTVMPIDFDMSQKIAPADIAVNILNKDGVPILMGTPGYIAPEIRFEGKYSYGSDVFALGSMLEKMGLPKEIYGPMKAPEAQRISLAEAMAAVAKEMRKPEYAQNPEVMNALKQYENLSLNGKKAPEIFEKLNQARNELSHALNQTEAVSKTPWDRDEAWRARIGAELKEIHQALMSGNVEKTIPILEQATKSVYQHIEEQKNKPVKSPDKETSNQNTSKSLDDLMAEMDGSRVSFSSGSFANDFDQIEGKNKKKTKEKSKDESALDDMLAEMNGTPKAESKKIESIDDLFKDFERAQSDSKSNFNFHEALEQHEEKLNQNPAEKVQKVKLEAKELGKAKIQQVKLEGTEFASAKATFNVTKVTPENLAPLEKVKATSAPVEQAAVPIQEIIVPRDVRLALIEMARAPEQFFQNNADMAKWQEIKRNMFPSLTDANDSNVVKAFLSSPIKVTPTELEKLGQFLEPVYAQQKAQQAQKRENDIDREIRNFVAGLSNEEAAELFDESKVKQSNQTTPVQSVKLQAQELGQANLKIQRIKHEEELASAKATFQETNIVQQNNIATESEGKKQNNFVNLNISENNFSFGFDSTVEGIAGNVINTQNAKVKTKKNFKNSLKNALKSPGSRLRHFAMPQIVPVVKPEQDQLFVDAFNSAKEKDGFITSGLAEGNKIPVTATIGKKSQILNTYEFVPDELAKQPVQDRKYMIKFNGNAEFAADKITESVKEAQKLGCVAIAFDYPGVMNDGAKAKNTKQLVEAGKAQVQQLLDQGVPASSIVLDGHSLGGAVATLVAAHFHKQTPPQEVFLINDRSFSKLSTEVEVLMTQKYGSAVGKMAGAAIKATGLEMNAKKAYNSIPDTHKMLVFAEKDVMIPWQSSLAKAVAPPNDRKRVQWEQALRDCDHDEDISNKKNGLGKSGEQLREAFFKKAGFEKQIEIRNEKTVRDKPKTETPKEMNALDVPHINPVTPIRNLQNLREPRLNRSASLNDLDKNTNNQPTRPRSNST